MLAPVFLTVTQSWLPPVGVAARTLADVTVGLGTLTIQAALGLTLAAAATATTVLAHNRR